MIMTTYGSVANVMHRCDYDWQQLQHPLLTLKHSQFQVGQLRLLPLILLLFTTVLQPGKIVPVFGQEKPFVTLPRFEYNNSTFRTNVCSRQADIDSGKLDLRSALTGLNLSVAITNYKVPNENLLFSLSSEGGINETDPGLFVVILDEIAKRAGFQWRDTYSAIDPIDSTVDRDNTWSDLLSWEVDHFDISAEYWGRTPERMARRVSFPQGWFDGDVVLVQSLAGHDVYTVSLWSFLLPFDWYVWMTIICMIFFTGIMYLVLERLNTDSDERELESKPLVSIFIAAITFTGHFEYRPKTNPARLLSFSWTFWALIIASAYTANLANFLIRRRSSTINIVGTLQDALKFNTPVCVVGTTVIDDFVSKRYPDMVIVRKSSEKEMFDALRLPWYNSSSNDGCGAVMTIRGIFDTYRRNQQVNWDCSLTSENKVVQRLPTGFATAIDAGEYCTSLISYVLNLHFTEMNKDGFVAEAFENYFKKISTANCPARYDNTENIEKTRYSLSVTDLSGIFIVHGCSIFAALLYAAYDRRRKRKVM